MGILDRSESRDGYTVRVLVLHTTEGGGTAAALRDATWWVGSSHAIADEQTLLTPAQGMVPYDQAAWTLRSGNRWSENIEQVGYAKWTRAEWLAHPGTLENTARWLADRSKARGIPLVKLTAAQYRAGGKGVIGHVDHTTGYNDGTHWDPGPDYPYDVVIARARQIAAGATTPEDPFMALSDAAQKKLADQIDTLAEWSQKKVGSRRGAGAPVLETTLFDFVRYAEGEAYRTEQRLAGLQAAVNKLADAVAGDDLTAEQLKAAVRDAIAESVVNVDVSVSGQQPPAA